MSLSLGQTLAGLLNATFGNAVEIIVGIVALFKGEVRIVQTSVCTRPEAFFIHSYTWLPFTDARFNFIKHTFGFRLFLLCRHVEVFGSMSARSHLTHLTAGIFIHESEFRVTAAQTLVSRLCGSLCVLI
jgi:hypothetical protein